MMDYIHRHYVSRKQAAITVSIVPLGGADAVRGGGVGQYAEPSWT